MAALVAGASDARAADAAVAPSAMVAIQRAVASRMGVAVADVSVTLDSVQWAGDAAVVTAVPDLRSRLDHPVHFTLVSEATGTRVGDATATLAVTADAVQVTARVPKGARLSPDSMVVGRISIERGALAPFVRLEDAVGAIAAHDLEAGVAVTAPDLLAEPLVRPGDRVHAVLRVGGARIETLAVAVQSGGRNDVVSLVNAATRRAFRGRVLARGEVEVIDVR